LALRLRDKIDDAELDELLAEIDQERRNLEGRLTTMEPPEEPAAVLLSEDLLTTIRERLPHLDAAQRNEIVALLVRQILIDTTVQEDGHKFLKVTIEYRFPGVPLSITGTRASQNYTSLKRVVTV
jgi:hypothetical protein